MRLGLGLGFNAGAAGIIILASIAGNASGTLATATPPAGFAWVAGAITINVPAKSGSMGAPQTVAATIDAAGVITEGVAGSWIAAIAAAGWSEGDTITASATGTLEESP